MTSVTIVKNDITSTIVQSPIDVVVVRNDLAVIPVDNEVSVIISPVVETIAITETILNAAIEQQSTIVTVNQGADPQIVLPSFLVLALSGLLQNERVLTAGSNISFSDNGPNNTLVINATGGSSGVTDHGALTGLLDDDHPQYHNDTRGDLRYWSLLIDLVTQVELGTILANYVPTIRQLTINGDTKDLSVNRSWSVNTNPGGNDTEIQFNDTNNLNGDSGLVYNKTTKQLRLNGNTDKTTPMLKARAGDFRASGIVLTGLPNGDILYTAIDVGSDGNNITISYAGGPPNQILSINIVSTAIIVNLATDSGALITSTANDVLVAINADIDAAALVTATLAPGSDGSDLVSAGQSVQLSGGASAADVAWIDERGRLNVQLQTGVGDSALLIRDPDGNVVAHTDNDGGFGFASERFNVSQDGILSVNTAQPLPLAGNPTMQYAINGSTLFAIAAGGGYSFSVFSAAPGDILFNVAAGAGQTGDLFVAFDENFNKTFRILPNGDGQFDQIGLGIIQKSPNGDRWRIAIDDSGNLGTELVV